MKIIISILSVFFIAMSLNAETKHGLELASLDKRDYHLKTFMKIFHEYCYGRDSAENVIKELNKTEDIFKSKEYGGVYEVFYDELSYGITPEPDSCVVDILLEYEPGKLLFSLKEIISNIEVFQGYAIHISKEIVEQGPSNENLLTSEITFSNSSKSSNNLILTYPLDNQDVWYMTLSYKYR